MVPTRGTSDKIKSAVNDILLNSLKDPQFIKTMADKVVEAV